MLYSAFPKVVVFFFRKNATFPIIVAFLSKMAYFKNGLFQKCLFQKSPISKNGLFQKIGLFQKLIYFKNQPISKIGFFQKFHRGHNYWKRDVFLEKKRHNFWKRTIYICDNIINYNIHVYPNLHRTLLAFAWQSIHPHQIFEILKIRYR